MRDIMVGSVDVTLSFRIPDATSPSGAGLTGLVFNTSGLTAYYFRERSAGVQITLATQTVTGAHSDGGFVEISALNLPGHYRLDLPDAAVAAGASFVVVELKGAANMVPISTLVPLVGYDPSLAIPTAAQIATAVAAPSAATIAASVLGRVGVIRSGTAQGGDGTHIQLDAGASAVDDVYNGLLCMVVGGPGVGQVRVVEDYVGATKQALVTAWATNPDNTSKFVLVGA
jgi:hypothetical protein